MNNKELNGEQQERKFNINSFVKSWKTWLSGTGLIIITYLGGCSEWTGISLSSIFEKKDSVEQSIEHKLPSQKVTTSGSNSPAVITEDGDVNITFGESALSKDSIPILKTNNK